MTVLPLPQEPSPAPSDGAMAERGRTERPQKTGAGEAVIYSVHRRLVFVLDNWAKPALLTNI